MEADSAPANLVSMIDKALQMTDERLRTSPLPMLSSIRTQLQFMKDTVAAGRAPTTDEKNRLTIGVIAARELEQTDSDYAEALSDAVFEFKKL